MGYRGKVKNRDNNRKGFGESFEHDPPPWRTLI
jgi:hypothetical protein